MQAVIAPVCLLCLLAVSGTARAAAVGAEQYVGRWEIVMANTPDARRTFRACSLLLDQKDGGLLGEVVYRWGSVAKITKPGVVSVDEETGDLLVRQGGFRGPIRFTLAGDAILGVGTLKGGKRIYFVGTRGESLTDINGDWETTLTGDDGQMHGTLKVRDDGYGRITAEAYREDGTRADETRLKKATLTGEKLELLFESERSSGETLHLLQSCQIQGDRMAGTVTVQETGAALTCKGTRQRRWGEPLQLITDRGLADWHVRSQQEKLGWSCRDGILHNDAAPCADIVSNLKFKDFKLHLEYKVAEHSNSGVYLRGRYEAQIVDDFGKGIESHGNGAIYSRIPQKINNSKRPGEWQAYEITLIGRYVTIVLNGKTIIDNERLGGITGGALDPYESQHGPIMLQGDHGKVWYRNISITPAL